MTRLKNIYEKEIVSKLMSKLSLKNKHDVPKVEKIILKINTFHKSRFFMGSVTN